jgi:hypothetical protein
LALTLATTPVQPGHRPVVFAAVIAWVNRVEGTYDTFATDISNFQNKQKTNAHQRTLALHFNTRWIRVEVNS